MARRDTRSAPLISTRRIVKPAVPKPLADPGGGELRQAEGEDRREDHAGRDQRHRPVGDPPARPRREADLLQQAGLLRPPRADRSAARVRAASRRVPPSPS